MGLCLKWQGMKHRKNLFGTMTVKKYVEKRARERKRESGDDRETSGLEEV